MWSKPGSWKRKTQGAQRAEDLAVNFTSRGLRLRWGRRQTGHGGNVVAMAVGGCQQGPSTLGAEVGRVGVLGVGWERTAIWGPGLGDWAGEGWKGQGWKKPVSRPGWQGPMGAKMVQEVRKRGWLGGNWPGHHAKVGGQGGIARLCMVGQQHKWQCSHYGIGRNGLWIWSRLRRSVLGWC